MLHHKLGYGLTLHVDFSYPGELHVFDNQTLLADIPPSWARHSLLMEPLNPPILVTQIELAKGEWLYLAALLPAPYMTLEEATLPPHQFRFIVLLSAILFLFTFLLVRCIRAITPSGLSRCHPGKDIDQAALPEEGASEIVAVTRAINDGASYPPLY